MSGWCPGASEGVRAPSQPPGGPVRTCSTAPGTGLAHPAPLGDQAACGCTAPREPVGRHVCWGPGSPGPTRQRRRRLWEGGQAERRRSRWAAPRWPAGLLAGTPALASPRGPEAQPPLGHLRPLSARASLLWWRGVRPQPASPGRASSGPRRLPAPVLPCSAVPPSRPPPSAHSSVSEQFAVSSCLGGLAHVQGQAPRRRWPGEGQGAVRTRRPRARVCAGAGPLVLSPQSRDLRCKDWRHSPDRVARRAGRRPAKLESVQFLDGAQARVWGSGPSRGACERQALDVSHVDFSLSLFLPPPPHSLNINK